MKYKYVKLKAEDHVPIAALADLLTEQRGATVYPPAAVLEAVKFYTAYLAGTPSTKAPTKGVITE